MNALQNALNKVGTWVMFSTDTQVRNILYKQYIGPSIERPKSVSIASMNKFGAVPSPKLGHVVFLDPFGTIWSPTLKKHSTTIEAGVTVTLDTLTKLKISSKTVRSLPRLPTSDQIINIPPTIDGGIGIAAMGEYVFILTLKSHIK